MAAKPLRFLTSLQVQRLHIKNLAYKSPTQPDLLESAVYSPINEKHYAKQENVFQLAAGLSEKIMKNHPFMDGNKRTALLAADMFLKINGHVLQELPLAQDENNEGLAKAQVSVVTNEWDVERLGHYYESVAKPLTQ